jgi:hypothetical protein
MAGRAKKAAEAALQDRCSVSLLALGRLRRPGAGLQRDDAAMLVSIQSLRPGVEDGDAVGAQACDVPGLRELDKFGEARGTAGRRRAGPQRPGSYPRRFRRAGRESQTLFPGNKVGSLS